MANPVGMFPAQWRTTVEVLRSGGRDRLGTPQPETPITVPGCLIGQRSTTEPDRDISHTQTRLSLYRDPDPTFTFHPTDRIRTPNGTIYEVDGNIGFWPLGVEVPLQEI